MPAQLLSGNGDPNGVQVGNAGDLYLDLQGRVWINTAFPSTWTQLSRVITPTAVITADTVVEPNVVARVNTSTGPVTITLPLAVNSRGISIVVKDVGGLAPVNNITIVPFGSDTIDTSNAVIMATSRGSFTFTSDGVDDWMITAQSG